MLTTLTVLMAAIVMVVLALAMTSILGWANRAFHVDVDARIEAIQEALPGANCGGCGSVGCGEYAEAIVVDHTDVNLCPVGGPGLSVELAEIMGVEVEYRDPVKAVVYCHAEKDTRLGVLPVEGEHTCSGAHLIGGGQSCTYGCLGLGECVDACEYDALEVVNGLASVDYVKCIGCGACAKVCPRHLIKMESFQHHEMVVVKCNNLDAGPSAKKSCKVACIACKACAKMLPKVFTMDGDLARTSHEQNVHELDLEPVMDKCPTSAITIVGIPETEKVALKVAETAE